MAVPDPAIPSETPVALAIEMIPAAQIRAGQNDRTTFDPAGLAELAESIRVNGLLQPITLRRLAPDAYQLVAGERRYRAMVTLLHWNAVPALVRALTDEDASALMLLENTARVALHPLEEATAYRVRRDTFGWTLPHIAGVAGVAVSRVQKRLALLTLIPEVQTIVRHGHLPLGHAELLTQLDANRQLMALRVYQAHPGLPLSRFREITGALLQAQAQQALFDLEQFLVVQVAADAQCPASGRHADTGVPVRDDVPAITVQATDTTADIIERFIHDLATAGLGAEAAALGTLYDRLVKGHYLSRARQRLFG